MPGLLAGLVVPPELRMKFAGPGGVTDWLPVCRTAPSWGLTVTQRPPKRSMDEVPVPTVTAVVPALGMVYRPARSAKTVLPPEMVALISGRPWRERAAGA